MNTSGTTVESITDMLRAWRGGEADASDRLFHVVYKELHRQAAGFLRHERVNHTLQASALINEAYLRLADQREVSWQNRRHFFAIASQAMRRILVDHAKGRNREKRGGPNEAVELNEDLAAAVDAANVDLIALDEALSRLALLDPQQEQIVELRYFGGLSMDDIARTLGIHRATAARDWRVAKAWLFREMTR